MTPPKTPQRADAEQAAFELILDNLKEAFSVDEPPSAKTTYQFKNKKLKIDKVEWVSPFDVPDRIVDDLVERLNEVYEALNDNSVVYCRIENNSWHFDLSFCGSNGNNLYSGEFNYDTLKQPGSIRAWRTESMDDDNEKTTDQGQLRPRWAEEARPKKQVKLRLEPTLIKDVDAAASAEGVTRNDWIEKSLRKSLKPDS